MSIWKKLFGKNRPEDNEIEQEDRGTLVLGGGESLRRMLYDTGYPDPEDILTSLGYTPESDEVREAARADSNRRVLDVQGIFPLIVFFTEPLNEALLLRQMDFVDEIEGSIAGHQIDEDLLASASMMRGEEIRNVVTAVIANLVDIGAIEIRDIGRQECFCGECGLEDDDE